MANANKWAPLPADYDKLTEQGQCEARVAAVSNHATPQDLVAAWAFFRDYYLASEESEAPFYKRPLSSPPLHSQMVYELGRYAFNAIAAPRASAKSVVMGTEIPLLFLLTKPRWETALCLATESMIHDRFDNIMYQLENNKLILEDFGRLRPKKGEGIWNRKQIRLTTRATLSGYPVLGKKRGMRPDLFILDDPEFDVKISTDQEKLHREFETLLFRVILPALEAGAGLFWIGTIVRRRCYLYYSCTSDDPRFKFWNRRILSAVDGPLIESNTKLMWPEKWSIPRLRTMREQMGPAAFNAEMRNEPVASGDRVFELVPSMHYYHIQAEGEVTTDLLQKGRINNPLDSNLQVTYQEPAGTPRSSFHVVESSSESDQLPASVQVTTTLGELASSMYRIMLVDYAPTRNRLSDYNCAHVMGYTRKDVLYSLDMYLGKPRTDDDLLRIIYSLALRWRPRVIGVENVAMQTQLEQSVSSYFETAAALSGWTPRIVGIGKGHYKRGIDKGQRIQAIQWRFPRYRIKFPGHRIGVWPYSELIHQVENFTPDPELLDKDDAIDTLGMQQFIVRGKGFAQERVISDADWQEQIRKGELYDRTGLPLAASVDVNNMSHEIIKKLLDMGADNEYNAARIERRKGLRGILR